MNFINLPGGGFRGKRRLVPVPSLHRGDARLQACYHADMDATAVELPYLGGEFSLILMLPGKQTEFVARELPWLGMLKCLHWERGVVGSSPDIAALTSFLNDRQTGCCSNHCL